MSNTAQVLDDLDGVEAKYNGDNDIIPGTPSVTWTDYQLLHAIKALTYMVTDLQRQIGAHEEVLNKLEGK